MAVSEHTREMAKGALWSFAGNAGVKLISFFYLVLLARMVTPDDVGTFYVALGIFGILSIFADFGFSLAFVRYTPYLISKNETGKLVTLLKVSYVAVFILSIVVGTLIFFQADRIAGLLSQSDALKADEISVDPASLALSLRLLSPYLLLSVIFNMNTGFLAGKKKMREQSELLTFQTIAKFLLTAGLFFFIGASLFSIAMAFVLSFLAALILSLFYMRKSLAGLGGGSGGDISGFLKEVIPFGLMLSIVTSLWTIIGYIDKIMIYYLLKNPALTGIYSMAVNFSSLIMIFPSAIAAIFLPLISGYLGQGKKQETNMACETSLRWMIFATVPLTLVMLAFPDSILRMFYGDAYAIGGVAMAIFAIGLFIRSISYTQSLVLAGMRLVGIELRVVAVAAIANVALNLLLIPILGINGASISSAIAFTISSVLFIYYGRKIINFRFPPESLKAIIAGFIALVLILLARPYLTDALGMVPSLGEGAVALYLSKALKLLAFGVLFLISLALYAVLLFFMKSFHSEDIEVFSATMRRARVPGDWVSGLSDFLIKGVHE